MKTKLFVFLLVGLSIIPLLDLFKPGLPITHDGQDHVARIANFYKNLSEGNFIPRWAGNLNWGYGHPILIFLYPLPSYIASFFHFLGFSLVDSTKFVFGLAFTASGLAMYIWLREALGEKGGFIGAILYMFAPYRFVDLYVRGAIGEHVAFIFPPLIFYFLLKLSKKAKIAYVIGGSFSFAGLILSHNAITLMFLPVIFLYILYLLLQCTCRKYFILHTCYVMLLGFGLSAFFWVPGVFEGKYTLRNIVTAGSYLDRFVDPKALLYGPWSYGGSGAFTVQLGIMHWIGLLFSPFIIFLFKKRKDGRYLLLLVFIISTLVAIFLMLKQSNHIWDKVMLLQNFQFPWRFLAITVFTTSILGALLCFVIPKKYQSLFTICYLLFAIFLGKDYWHAKGYLYKPESFFTNIYESTTDTGESAPIWSVRFMEKRPKVHMEIIDGKAQIIESGRYFTKHDYKITALERSRIRENTLYFPGWDVFVDGKKADVEFQDPSNRGLITFFLEKGNHIVSIRFQETKLRLVANIISLLSLFFIAILGILKETKLWQGFRWFWLCLTKRKICLYA